MDSETPPTDLAAGPYTRRAEALLAARADLFGAVPSQSFVLAGAPRAPRDRHASRQLTLPLPRERSLRRARMVR